MQQEKQGEKHRTNKNGKGIKAKIHGCGRFRTKSSQYQVFFIPKKT